MNRKTILLMFSFFFLIGNTYAQKSFDAPDRNINPRAYLRVNVNIADVRGEPSRRAELVSQALYNEVVEILDADERYKLIKQHDGYEGWIKSGFLSKIDFDSESNGFLVTSALVPAKTSSGADAKIITWILYGTILYGEANGGFLKIQSDRYGECYIEVENNLEIMTSEYPDFTDINIINEAEKFLGVPYLWGGRSFFGIDCSGFTQAVLRRFGLQIPRDSKDQIKTGFRINREDIKAGDILFFPNHVALAVSGDMYIHATGANGGVAYNSLNPESPVYHKRNDEEFITARRVMNESY